VICKVIVVHVGLCVISNSFDASEVKRKTCHDVKFAVFYMHNSSVLVLFFVQHSPDQFMSLLQ